jgi:hypothetical protein
MINYTKNYIISILFIIYKIYDLIFLLEGYWNEINIYNFLYRVRLRLWCFAKHNIFRVLYLYLKFKSSNGQFNPLNMIFILKYIWRSNITFFWKFLLFLDGYKIYWSNNFCTISILLIFHPSKNTKKFLKI